MKQILKHFCLTRLCIFSKADDKLNINLPVSQQPKISKKKPGKLPKYNLTINNSVSLSALAVMANPYFNILTKWAKYYFCTYIYIGLVLVNYRKNSHLNEQKSRSLIRSWSQQ
jgi:amino acid transporter